MHLKRLKKELSEFQKEPADGVDASPIDGDWGHWQAFINGPATGPYRQGTFKLDVVFPSDYPFKPPTIKFITPIFHPEVNNGAIHCCHLLILHRNWSPALTLLKVLLAIRRDILEDYSSTCGTNPEATSLLRDMGEAAFEAEARAWTTKFAMGTSATTTTKAAVAPATTAAAPATSAAAPAAPAPAPAPTATLTASADTDMDMAEAQEESDDDEAP